MNCKHNKSFSSYCGDCHDEQGKLILEDFNRENIKHKNNIAIKSALENAPIKRLGEDPNDFIERYKIWYREEKVPALKEEIDKHPTITKLRELSESMKKFQKENEGYTFYLPYLPPVGVKPDWTCNYCYRPKEEHREDGRCPIKNCTLFGGPPKEIVE